MYQWYGTMLLEYQWYQWYGHSMCTMVYALEYHLAGKRVVPTKVPINGTIGTITGMVVRTHVQI
jgi:hypothetical protein